MPISVLSVTDILASEPSLNLPGVGDQPLKEPPCTRSAESGAERRREIWDDFVARVDCLAPPFSQPFQVLSIEDEVPESIPGACLDRHYDMKKEQIEWFGKNRYIRLKGVLPPDSLLAAKKTITRLATSACQGLNPSLPPPGHPVFDDDEAGPEQRMEHWSAVSEPNVKSFHLQMMWAVDPTTRAVVLSPRIAGIVARLLGCEKVRLYHDNCLSRAPGSQRTKWHCDDGPKGYMAMTGRRVATVWIPLQRTSPARGALVFPRMHEGREGRCITSWDVAELEGCPPDEKTDAYDRFVSASLEHHGAVPDEDTYEIGDVSIHATDCFHAAGPNICADPRMILAATYFADGTTMR